jgi:hypothetical protein
VDVLAELRSVLGRGSDAQRRVDLAWLLAGSRRRRLYGPDEQVAGRPVGRLHDRLELAERVAQLLERGEQGAALASATAGQRDAHLVEHQRGVAQVVG